MLVYQYIQCLLFYLGGFEVPLSLTGAFRIVVAAWCLLAVVLCNSYNQSKPSDISGNTVDSF